MIPTTHRLVVHFRFSLLLAVAWLASASSPAAERPNILLILADDLGYGDVSCYNPESKIPTPHLDKLASEGMRFTDAHSPSTVCTPTRYSIMTGRMAFRTGFKGVFTGVGGPCMIEKERLTLPADAQATRLRHRPVRQVAHRHELPRQRRQRLRIEKEAEGGVEGVLPRSRLLARDSPTRRSTAASINSSAPSAVPPPTGSTPTSTATASPFRRPASSTRPTSPSTPTRATTAPA